MCLNLEVSRPCRDGATRVSQTWVATHALQAKMRSAAPVATRCTGAVTARLRSSRPRHVQNFYHAPNQIVLMRLRDLDGYNVAGLRSQICFRHLNVIQVQLAVNFGRHALETRLPDQRRVLGRPFDQGGRALAAKAPQLARGNLLLNFHQAILAAL